MVLPILGDPDGLRLRLASPPRPPEEICGTAAGHDAAPGAARGQCGSWATGGAP